MLPCIYNQDQKLINVTEITNQTARTSVFTINKHHTEISVAHIEVSKIFIILNYTPFF